jgi:hypothetical protein
LSPPWVPHFLRKPAKAACVEASKEILWHYRLFIAIAFWKWLNVLLVSARKIAISATPAFLWFLKHNATQNMRGTRWWTWWLHYQSVYRESSLSWVTIFCQNFTLLWKRSFCFKSICTDQMHEFKIIIHQFV